MPHRARRVGAKIVSAPGLHKDVIGAGDAAKRVTLSSTCGTFGTWGTKLPANISGQNGSCPYCLVTRALQHGAQPNRSKSQATGVIWLLGSSTIQSKIYGPNPAKQLLNGCELSAGLLMVRSDIFALAGTRRMPGATGPHGDCLKRLATKPASLRNCGYLPGWLSPWAKHRESRSGAQTPEMARATTSCPAAARRP